MPKEYYILFLFLLICLDAFFVIMYFDSLKEEKNKIDYNNDRYNRHIKNGYKYVKNEYTLMEYKEKSLIEYYLSNNNGKYTIFASFIFKLMFLPSLISVYIIIWVFKFFNTIYKFLFLKQNKLIEN